MIFSLIENVNVQIHFLYYNDINHLIGNILKQKVVTVFYYMQDFNLLYQARQILSRFGQNSLKHFVCNKLDEVPRDVDHCIYVIDAQIDKFQKYIKDQSKQHLVIVINQILNDFEDYPHEAYISQSKIVTGLSAIIYDQVNSLETHEDFLCVNINNISLNKSSPCDLYFKINEKKFLKCLYNSDIFDLETKDHFLKKSEYLWVKKEDYYLFGYFLYGEDDLEREVTSPFSAEKLESIEFLHDLARSCGISDKAILAVEESIKSFHAHPEEKIKNMIMSFEDCKGSFLYAHSYLTSLLAVEILSNISWFTKDHIDKLVLASIIHDLGYQEAENAIFEGLPKSKILELPYVTRQDVIQHVDRVLHALKDCERLDTDVLNIISRHHGARGEESYPQKSTAMEIDLLSGVFLLTHSFIVCLFKMSFDMTKASKIMAYLESIYNKGNIKQVFPEFKEKVLRMF